MLERKFTVKEEKLFLEHQRLMKSNNPFDSIDTGSDGSRSRYGGDSRRGQHDIIYEHNSSISAIESMREKYSNLHMEAVSVEGSNAIVDDSLSVQEG